MEQVTSDFMLKCLMLELCAFKISWPESQTVEELRNCLPEGFQHDPRFGPLQERCCGFLGSCSGDWRSKHAWFDSWDSFIPPKIILVKFSNSFMSSYVFGCLFASLQELGDRQTTTSCVISCARPHLSLSFQVVQSLDGRSRGYGDPCQRGFLAALQTEPSFSATNLDLKCILYICTLFCPGFFM